MNVLLSIILAAGLNAGLIAPLDRSVVSTEWLAANLGDPRVVVVEIGASGAQEHLHIPGARFIAIESIVARDGWPPDELPRVDELRKAFESAGVGDDGHIVLYSAHPLYASRAWFTLDYLGQAERTSILDGGWQRWVAEKRPMWTERRSYAPKTFTPSTNSARVISHADMRRAIAGGAVLIDARSAQEFHGYWRGESVARSGHIPGAHGRPWQANLTALGTFRSREELRASYAGMIGNADQRVILYCRTGMEASVPYVVLRSLGYDVALYDGSYAAWSRDPSAPVTKLSMKR